MSRLSVFVILLRVEAHNSLFDPAVEVDPSAMSMVFSSKLMSGRWMSMSAYSVRKKCNDTVSMYRSHWYQTCGKDQSVKLGLVVEFCKFRASVIDAVLQGLVEFPRVVSHDSVEPAKDFLVAIWHRLSPLSSRTVRRLCVKENQN